MASEPGGTRRAAVPLDPLDAYLPEYDVADSVLCAVANDARAAAWALHTYNVGADAGVVSDVLRALSRALPPASRAGIRLVQLRRLSDAAMEATTHGLVLGFIGRIWQPNAPIRLPAAADFAIEAARSNNAACVVWNLEVLPGLKPTQLRLLMRLRYPRRGSGRWLCVLYWRGVRRLSVWARTQLLRSIARHAARAPQ